MGIPATYPRFGCHSKGVHPMPLLNGRKRDSHDFAHPVEHWCSRPRVTLPGVSLTTKALQPYPSLATAQTSVGHYQVHHLRCPARVTPACPAPIQYPSHQAQQTDPHRRQANRHRRRRCTSLIRVHASIDGAHGAHETLLESSRPPAHLLHCVRWLCAHTSAFVL